jgi:hypothetical protein
MSHFLETSGDAAVAEAPSGQLGHAPGLLLHVIFKETTWFL